MCFVVTFKTEMSSGCYNGHIEMVLKSTTIYVQIKYKPYYVYLCTSH